ncbi:hypothetical protein [Neisseria montereyensis]|uniref:Uncharacterized protein n=1 Tax=Neisseria montereyensis TaxID=2973938 RepID=A0ABT2FCG9_9NEIS|nr:hypothetical protein [Neisseria montereyensis]MCS4533641.1 hypothetical protein [Neisseria montereyensis]
MPHSFPIFSTYSETFLTIMALNGFCHILSGMVIFMFSDGLHMNNRPSENNLLAAALTPFL